ncbi:MAG TPA: hypothetical protein VKF38_00395 [Anaerolineaceae bacterium]|nr:hypothetical protein [Anaerolineaceae bacterium]
MDKLIIPNSNKLYFVVGNHAAADRLLDLAARLALQGRLLILDCGNRANPLPLVRELRRLTNDPVQALGNIRLARAFTCYQVTALLEGQANQPIQQPVLIFDLLATFYDESLTYAEGRRLLDQSLGFMTHICRFAPVLASSKPPPAEFPERKSFLELVCNQSDVLWVEEAPVLNQSQQLSFLS